MIESTFMWDLIRRWLHEWGNLLVTVAIAGAAYLQWYVYKSLLKLEKNINDNQNRVEVFCTLWIYNQTPHFTVANLCKFGIWVERIDVTVGTETTPAARYRFIVEPYREISLALPDQFAQIVRNTDHTRTDPLPIKVRAVAHCHANGKGLTYFAESLMTLRFIHGAPRWEVEGARPG